jgi:hypothetical protein
VCPGEESGREIAVTAVAHRPQVEVTSFDRGKVETRPSADHLGPRPTTFCNTPLTMSGLYRALVRPHPVHGGNSCREAQRRHCCFPRRRYARRNRAHLAGTLLP